MLSDKIVKLLNEQINHEQYSSNLYLQMAAWCEFQGYSGSATFLKAHAAEELIHMHKLFDYLTECGALPILGTIKAVPSDYANLGVLFTQTLEHERLVTSGINNIAWAAFEEKDFATFQFLQWFIAEQHEEEHLFQTIVDKINIIGLDGKGIYYLDKEIRKLAPSAALP